MSNDKLFDAETSPLRLRVSECRLCGHRFFPPQQLGCEQCGAHGADLDSVSLAGRGTVAAAVAVHKHRGPGPAAPFTLTEVALENGPLVRGFLLDPPPGATSELLGRAVTAVAVPESMQGGLPPVRFQLSSSVESS